MGLFSKRSDEDIKKDIEKDITRIEIQINDLKRHIRDNDARIKSDKEYNRRHGSEFMRYDTLEWENQRDEKKIVDLENKIADLRKKLLRM